MKSHAVCAYILFGCAISLAGCGGSEPPPASNPDAAPPPAETPSTQTPAGSTTAPMGDTTAQTMGTTAPEAAGGAAAAGGADGAQVYQQYCSTCHGPKGAGDGPAAAGLNPKPASFAGGGFRLDPDGDGNKGEVEDIQAVVRDGAAKYGGSPLMAPWPMLTPEQTQAVAEHVKTLAGG